MKSLKTTSKVESILLFQIIQSDTDILFYRNKVPEEECALKDCMLAHVEVQLYASIAILEVQKVLRLSEGLLGCEAIAFQKPKIKYLENH